eukprot:1073101-Prymnesium_polylepis.1
MIEARSSSERDGTDWAKLLEPLPGLRSRIESRKSSSSAVADGRRLCWAPSTCDGGLLLAMLFLPSTMLTVDIVRSNDSADSVLGCGSSRFAGSPFTVDSPTGPSPPGAVLLGLSL